MAKTKEEITNITTKNYFNVQKQELDSVDALKTHHSAFTKETRASLTEYTKDLKAIEKEEASALKEFASQETDIQKRHDDHHKQVEINKNDAKKQLDKELDTHTKTFDKGVKELDKTIDKIKESHEKQLERLEQALQKDIEKSNKNITDIEEKGVKDEATFVTKLENLDTKYNEKVEALTTKETTKIEKLSESTKQKLSSIEDMIQKELDKHNKALATKQALYEEELQEIDEKITFEKSEFDTKYNSIKESVEKRIAVREKHLQRALNDNDKRSAKQHKKDIAKFQKEADHDLVVLEKNYHQKEKESSEYRKQFIKDYYEDVASLNEQFATYKEEKLQAMELEQASLEHAINTTKLEYNQARAKELSEYNESFAHIREKQETAKMQRDLAIEQEKHNQLVYAIEQQQQLEVANKELEDELETKAKERRVLVLQKQKDDDVSNNTYQEALVRLDAEAELADLEQNRDLVILNHNKNISTHTMQHKRHTSVKDEFASYQKHIGPLFLNRTRDIQAYETVEIENRLNLKLAFYDKMRKDLDGDYTTLKDKLEDNYKEEATFLEAQIQDLSGDKTEELAEFVKTKEAYLRELRSSFEGLTEFKDRKERKTKEQQYDKESRAFQNEKAKRETELHQQVGAYQTLLEDVKNRHQTAMKDIKEAYDKSVQLLQDAVDQFKEHTNNELANANHLITATDDIFQQFNLQVASRTQQQTDAHNTYLNTQVKREQDAIVSANQTFDRNRDLLNDDMQAKLTELSQERQSLLTKYKADVDLEESNLDQYKSQIRTSIEDINNKANQEKQQQSNVFTETKSTLTATLTEVVGAIKATFQTQTTDYNQTLDGLQKETNAEVTRYENKQKQIKKESAEKLKEAVRQIKTTLQQHIQSI